MTTITLCQKFVDGCHMGQLDGSFEIARKLKKILELLVKLN